MSHLLFADALSGEAAGVSMEQLRTWNSVLDRDGSSRREPVERPSGPAVRVASTSSSEPQDVLLP